MKAGLQVRLGQSLTLTPQLRQAIRLLQLSGLELDAEVSAAVDANPLLEREDDPPPDSGGEASTSETVEADAGSDGEGDGDAQEERFGDDWDAMPARTSYGDDEDGTEPESHLAPESLRDHLLWQLRLSHLGERDLRIGEALIEAINEDGYLSGSLADIAAALPDDWHVSAEEIETLLHLVQHFDPLGVGSRSLAECLQVQLQALSADTPGRDLALRLCTRLDEVARLTPARLVAQLDASPAETETALALLRSLEPRPGGGWQGDAPEYIAPDALVYRAHGVWKVRLSAGSQPRLAINRHYQSLIGKASRDDDSYLRGQLQEARWLIKALETRADTVLRVAQALIRHQSGFLEAGPEALRPLTLRQIAEELALHESTISRATSRKFLRTPRGTFEFKYFFCSGVENDLGGASSSTAIQARLRKLIEAEEPDRPLSDQRLAEILKAEGIPVARRTVAKYREAMNIPASNERQRQG